MTHQKTLLIFSDPNTGQMLEKGAFRPAGFEVTYTQELAAAETLLRGVPPDLVILSEQLPDGSGLEIGASLIRRYPSTPFILLSRDDSDELAIEAFRTGFADYLKPPLQSAKLLQAAQAALERYDRLRDWARLETRRNTKSLQEKVDGLEALQRIGRKVTASLDLDSVLTAVVDAAVELTGAEEGSLLLLDDSTGELYMRAERNFQDEFVRTFRLPIRDTLAGQVVRSGKPILIDTDTPQKIKTAYLVYTLIYVPLIVQDRVIGVLEVDNRKTGHVLNDYHVALVSALADYAAIAVENANLFSCSEVERSKMATILTKIEEGVIVIDHDRRIILVNRMARSAFNLGDENLNSKPIRDVLPQNELLDILSDDNRTSACQIELSLADGRVFNAQVTPIPEVGLAVTMQDISHLKELDRIKSDFVSTVSHDLRSPLTAILGYVELIDRVGPVTDQQKEFIRRVQASVHNITALINDLLDLGRIEAGFDSRKEIVPISVLIRYVIEGYQSRAAEKSQELILKIEDDMPTVLGNPIRLRQMVSNLVGNAIKYTQPRGKIGVLARAEDGQVIIQVSDNGPGIPSSDQPYIFDKFYRASNTASETPGTGLGLAIVRSIVENHQGRIWVDSAVGQGSTFTVVLPISDQRL